MLILTSCLACIILGRVNWFQTENFLTVQVAEVLIPRWIGCLISAIDLVMQNPALPGIRHIVRHSQQEQVGNQMTQKSFPC